MPTQRIESCKRAGLWRHCCAGCCQEVTSAPCWCAPQIAGGEGAAHTPGGTGRGAAVPSATAAAMVPAAVLHAQNGPAPQLCTLVTSYNLQSNWVSRCVVWDTGKDRSGWGEVAGRGGWGTVAFSRSKVLPVGILKVVLPQRYGFWCVRRWLRDSRLTAFAKNSSEPAEVSLGLPRASGIRRTKPPKYRIGDSWCLHAKEEQYTLDRSQILIDEFFSHTSLQTLLTTSIATCSYKVYPDCQQLANRHAQP